MVVSEKRQSKRIKVKLSLTVSSLIGQDNDCIQLDSSIVVFDISKGGIGFWSRCILPMDYYFDAAVDFDNGTPVMNCVVKIIRCEALEDDEYSYGCESIKKPEQLDRILDDFENMIPACT